MCEYVYIYMFIHIYKYMFAQPTGAVEYTDCFSTKRLDPHPNEFPRYDSTIWWWGPSNAGAVGNVEYSYIDITTRSSLAQSTW